MPVDNKRTSTCAIYIRLHLGKRRQGELYVGSLWNSVSTISNIIVLLASRRVFVHIGHRTLAI